jgi:ankyrin repeat protein
LHIACRQKDSSGLNDRSTIGKSTKGSEVEIIKIILKFDKTADLNSQDTYGNTPVHLAAQNGKADILSFFLDNFYADIYVKNSEG